jgi:hypothetical protein
VRPLKPTRAAAFQARAAADEVDDVHVAAGEPLGVRERGHSLSGAGSAQAGSARGFWAAVNLSYSEPALCVWM